MDEKVKEKLYNYIKKRNFDITSEPGLLAAPSIGNRFCIQLHNASNLHYDLRLEDEGVLLSWAIPKGLPHLPGVKRLCIKTEDHPIHYLTYEGTIPKGQYGAGQMWVFTSGKFEWIERKEKSFTFRLNAKEFNRTFSLVNTNKDQWLIHLLKNEDFQQVSTMEPMLAGVGTNIPDGSKYFSEIKWDGIRAMIYVSEGKIKILSRSGRDISNQFPELLNDEYFDIESGIFDGEIVHLDKQGKPLFSKVISRLHTSSNKSIELGQKTTPVTCYLFDCLFLDGKHIIKETQRKRQEWLKTSLKKLGVYRVSEAIEDGKGLFEAVKKMGMEGIMVKKKDAPYLPGNRSNHWIKIKVRHRTICFIAGYTKGKGDRRNLFGSLHLLDAGRPDKKYMGKVGTGFDSNKMKRLLNLFEEFKVEKKPFQTKTDDDKNSIWLQPKLKCEIEYASLASTGNYREPVFIKLIEL